MVGNEVARAQIEKQAHFGNKNNKSVNQRHIFILSKC